MGKPYRSELAQLESTYQFALDAEIRPLVDIVRASFGRSLLVLGSGGSLSAAEFIVRMHESYSHQPAKSLTPLEFALHPVVEGTSVLILSAGGRNPDILEAVRHALTDDYESVAGLCATVGSPMGTLLRDCRHASVYEFATPSGKDGFLATNSLLATCVLAARAYQALSGEAFELPEKLPALQSLAARAWPAVAMARTDYRVLAAGWGVPAAVDFESKISESGLGAVSVTDYRNFAHGRHHGVARRLEQTTIVALQGPETTPVVEKTLKALPAELSRIKLETSLTGPAGALDLLVQVYHFIGALGSQTGMDPGKPSVPVFGRKLYHAGFKVSRSRRTPPEVTWLRRKVSIPGWESAAEPVRRRWRKSFQAWAEQIRATSFGAVVLDYDGTLSEPDERWGQPSDAVGRELTRLLDLGLYVGVATGRGGSALDALRLLLPQEHWPRVLVGVYNGGVRLALDESLPEDGMLIPEIEAADALLRRSEFLSTLARLKTRPAQITIEAAVPLPAGLLRRAVEEQLFRPGERIAVRLFQSGHSVDVIPTSSGKRAVVDDIERRLVQDDRAAQRALAVGDQGRSDGNDFELLASACGLSVERASTSLETCWNLAAPGERRTRALLRYLAALRPVDGGDVRFHLDDFLTSS